MSSSASKWPGNVSYFFISFYSISVQFILFYFILFYFISFWSHFDQFLYLSEIDGYKGISLIKTMIQRQPDDPEIAKISTFLFIFSSYYFFEIAKKWYIIFRLLLLSLRTVCMRLFSPFFGLGYTSVAKLGDDFKFLMNLRSNTMQNNEQLMELYLTFLFSSFFCFLPYYLVDINQIRRS